MNTFRKCVLFSLVTVGLGGDAFALTGGPVMPEYTQFEPFDATDMVSLSTGDFSYTIPLLDVPGTGGSFPVAMSYHAGIRHDQEATWVGLGWTLNPGAINRTVRGFPDDNQSTLAISHIYNEGGSVSGWGVGISFGFGPVGLSMGYDSNVGLTGVNFSLSITGLLNLVGIPMGFEALGGMVGLNARVNIGTSGASLSAGIGYGNPASSLSMGVGGSVGTGGTSTYSSIGVGRGIASAGYSWSSSGGGGFSIGGVSTGINPSSVSISEDQVSSKSTSSSFGFQIPFTSVSLSFYEYTQEWWVNVKLQEHDNGFLYQGGYGILGDVTNTNPIEPVMNIKSPGTKRTDENLLDAGQKFERQEQDKWIFSSQDIFNVNAQGVSGPFVALAVNPVQYIDNSKNDSNNKGIMGYINYPDERIPYNAGNDFIVHDFINDGAIDYTSPNPYSISDIQFRFLADPGCNFVSSGFKPTYIDGEPYNEFENIFRGISDEADIDFTTAEGTKTWRKFGSKIINPVIDWTTGGDKILGFDIVESDGRVYEFRHPVYNYFHVAYTSPSKTGKPSYSNSDFSYYLNTGQYASAWLLSAVKGPDYVDLLNDGCTDDDFGYWTKLAYQGTPNTDSRRYPYAWRAPYGEINMKTPAGKYQASYGIKDQCYLDTIETATHRALFTIEERKDGIGNNGFDMQELRTLRDRIDYNGVFDDYKYYETVGDNGRDITITYSFTIKDEGVKNTITKLIQNPNNLFNDKVIVSVKVPYKFLAKVVPSNTTVWRDVGPGTVVDDYFLDDFDLGSSTPFTISKPITIHIPGELDCCSKVNLDVYSGKGYIEPGATVSYNLMANVYNNQNDELNNKVMRLSDVKLYRKGIINPIKTIVFKHDYSLCPNTPNSITGNGGKLTLRSIEVVGQDGLSLPPYLFNYSNNFPYGTGDARRDAEKYDYYGFYNPTGTESMHMPQNCNTAGVAWNLSTIITPLGGQIDVEYERDEFYGVNAIGVSALNYPDEPSFYNEYTFQTSNIDHETKALTLDGTGIQITEGSVVFIREPRKVKNDIYRHPTTSVVIAPTNYASQYEPERLWGPYTIASVDGNTISINETNNCLTLIDQWMAHFENCGNPIQIVIPFKVVSVNVFPDEYAGYQSDAALIVTKDNQRYFGDGVKVTNVTSGDGLGNSFTTTYDYYAGDASGSITSGRMFRSPPTQVKCPSLYGLPLMRHVIPDPLEDRSHTLKNAVSGIEVSYIDENIELFRGEYESPAPTIIYGKVTVTNRDANGNMLNGKTVYEHYTADDKFYVKENGTSTIKERKVFEQTLINDKCLEIRDYSSIMGRLKSISYYEQTGPTTVPSIPVKKETFEYIFSEDMPNIHRVNYDIDPEYGVGVNEDVNEALGLIAQRHTFWPERASDPDEFYDVLHIVNNVFLAATETEVNGITTRNQTLAYDAYSGEVLVTQTEQVGVDKPYNPKKNRTKPAYWFYPEMFTRNMLKQPCQTATYEVVNGADKLRSSTVVNWSNELTDWNWPSSSSYVDDNDKPWYKWQTWRWLSAPSNNPTEDYDKPNETNIIDDSYPASDDWVLQGQISRYSNFGQVLEELDGKGNPTSKIFGYNHSHMTALCLNARADECGYNGFENGEINGGHIDVDGDPNNNWWISDAGATGIHVLDNTQAYTGEYSYKVLNAYGPTRDFPIDLSDDICDGDMVFSFWYLKISGSAVIRYQFATASHVPYNENGDQILLTDNSDGEWKYAEITIPASIIASEYNKTTDPARYIRVWGGFHSDETNGLIYIDDIRFHPVDALMATYTYDAGTGKLTSVTDENNNTKRFEYDGLGRLTKVFKTNSKDVVLKEHSYQYARD